MEERKKERKINRKKFTVKSYIFMEEKKLLCQIIQRQYPNDSGRKRERERERVGS